MPNQAMAERIERALSCASDQELRDGLDFYPGAHGLCRAFSRFHPHLFISAESVAGIYAALSPMNGWESNVANVLDVLRFGADARVNTSRPNLVKAVAIRNGGLPLEVLRGRKVTAFWRGIAFPDDLSALPIDRHLINLALGLAPDKNVQSRLASDPAIYHAVEEVYGALGDKHGMGNRLASIAWFVQRRLSRDFQLAMVA